jgi:hypothetical protein
MKKFLLLIMMGIFLTPSFAGGGKGKKKGKTEPQVEVQMTPVIPVNRERWIERDGRNYVIVTRTTISSEDYHRIKNTKND